MGCKWGKWKALPTSPSERAHRVHSISSALCLLMSPLVGFWRKFVLQCPKSARWVLYHRATISSPVVFPSNVALSPSCLSPLSLHWWQAVLSDQKQAALGDANWAARGLRNALSLPSFHLASSQTSTSVTDRWATRGATGGLCEGEKKAAGETNGPSGGFLHWDVQLSVLLKENACFLKTVYSQLLLGSSLCLQTERKWDISTYRVLGDLSVTQHMPSKRAQNQLSLIWFKDKKLQNLNSPFNNM